MNKELNIYIHWPFCRSKCPYCAFTSYCGMPEDLSFLSKAYHQQLLQMHKKTPVHTVSTIYFGGGTPSLMPISILENFLDQIFHLWHVSDHPEISIEVNPGTISLEKWQAYKRLGINRISLGIQSFQDKNLKFLGRTHTAEQSKTAIDQVQKLFSNISFDLMYGLQKQSIDDWQEDLRTALCFSPQHLSCYQLSIEKGTPFEQKKISPTSETKGKKLFKMTRDILKEEDFIPYEISNFAKKGYACCHNENIWKGTDYIGIGPAAHGRIMMDGKCLATEQALDLKKWIDDISTGNNQGSFLTEKERGVERIYMGLRYFHGIDVTDPQISHLLNGEKIKDYQSKRYLKETGQNLSLTEKGLFVFNYLIQDILK